MASPWTSLCVPLIVLLASGVWGDADPLSRAAADRMLQKADALRRNAESPHPLPGRVVVTEIEVNSYLAFDGAKAMPAGVVVPRVSLLPGGRVSARAIVDLDGVRRARSQGGWLDPLSYLSGRLPVTATGILTASGGLARLAFESADVSGVPVPKFLLQELVAFYTRSPDFPAGVSLDAPFPLPVGIRSITIDRGAATVEQ